MKAVRQTGTAGETKLRRALHRLGLRFRVDYRLKMSGQALRADIAFPRQQLSIYVDGCFWHSCPDHGTMPKTNVDYWRVKLAENVERDRRSDRLLRECGWTPIRVWEHELRGDRVDDVADAIAAAVWAAL